MSTTPELTIRHARILQPNGEFMVGDVRIRGDKILEVASTLDTGSEDHQEIDASGLTLLPGVIEPQVHFREPGRTRGGLVYSQLCLC